MYNIEYKICSTILLKNSSVKNVYIFCLNVFNVA